ncbi:MAG: radical SAM protein [Candidatus Omnitrophota bacterium]
MKIIEQKISTILCPTGINLADYVINPYQGCQLGCLFCYAQFSKRAQKEPRKWGRYVKVKMNGLEILKKELQLRAPVKVLIGSTTEPFQPIERKYGLTRGIIRILNQKKIKYVIMSRSMILEEYMGELDPQLCESVYFTVDIMPELIKQKLQPQAVSSTESIGLINRLIDSNINVIAYFCPVMPFLYELIQNVYRLQTGAKAEFEIVNFQMAGMKKIIKTIGQIYPKAAKKYQTMCADKLFYDNVMQDIKSDIREITKGCFKNIKIHEHEYADYFKNIYPPAQQTTGFPSPKEAS